MTKNTIIINILGYTTGGEKKGYNISVQKGKENSRGCEFNQIEFSKSVKLIPIYEKDYDLIYEKCNVKIARYSFKQAYAFTFVKIFTDEELDNLISLLSSEDPTSINMIINLCITL